MQELSSKSVKVGNYFEGPVQCPLMYDNAAPLCVCPEFYKGLLQPRKGARPRADPGPPLRNVPHGWILTENFLTTRPCNKG